MTFLKPESIQSVAIIGAGSVGAGWAALMLARGKHVYAYDPGPDAPARADALIASAWPSLIELGLTREAHYPVGSLTFCPSIAQAVAKADLVQENAPEHPLEKQRIIAEIDAAAAPDTIILSSTGGIPPSELQAACRHPERLIVFHPFNPTHLIPLVEVVPGAATLEAVTEWAIQFARHLGKHPIRLRAEMVGHMTNRLQFALVREAVRCLLEGVASPADIDAAVRYGLAPRWMLMGGLMTLHLAGGPGGMKGILEHAGKAIEEWWNPGEQLHLTGDIREKLVLAGKDLSGICTMDDLMHWRDQQLVPLLTLQSKADLARPCSKEGVAP